MLALYNYANKPRTLAGDPTLDAKVLDNVNGQLQFKPDAVTALLTKLGLSSYTLVETADVQQYTATGEKPQDVLNSLGSLVSGALAGNLPVYADVISAEATLVAGPAVFGPAPVLIYIPKTDEGKKQLSAVAVPSQGPGQLALLPSPTAKPVSPPVTVASVTPAKSNMLPITLAVLAGAGILYAMYKPAGGRPRTI